jgi:di/tricarboxylate transporter
LRRFLELFFEKRKQTKKETLLFIIVLAYIIIGRFFEEFDSVWLSIIVLIVISIFGIFIYLERKNDRKNNQ